MKINQTIPGQMIRGELETISLLATMVPKGGTIVETGSLLGLSAWHWSQNSDPSVEVICIDPWVRQKWIEEKVERKFNTKEFSVDLFREYTVDCTNVTTMQGYSPQVAAGWDRSIDLYFEDSVHRNPILSENLTFWGGFVRSGGIISGHDYSDAWPDVKSEAAKVAREFGVALNTKESVWWIKKP